MAVFLANRSLQISLDIQSRCRLIASRAQRGYKSSGPVRYVPKDGTQIKKSQNSPPLPTSERKGTDLTKDGALKGGRHAPRVPSFDDGRLQNRVFDAEIAKASDIFKQIEDFPEFEDANNAAVELMDTDVLDMSELFLDEASRTHETDIQVNEKINSKAREDAEKVAIELLATRAFTGVELQKKLRGKKYSSNIIESVIADLKCRGFLNDGLYAESFSQSRWRSSTWGPRRIKQALLRKGVSGVEADKAMKQVFEDGDTSSDCQSVQHGMSKLAMDHLFLQASKQWLRGQDKTLENRRSRIIRWLQYRGFSWGVTSIILRRLESQYPP